MPLKGSLPVILLNSFLNSGDTGRTADHKDLVDRSEVLSPESEIAWRTGPIVASTRSAVSSLNLALVRVISRCERSAVGIHADEGQVDGGSGDMLESSIFAFSAASFSLCMAILSPRRSTPLALLELVGDPVDNSLVEIVAAEAVVAGCGKNFLKRRRRSR